jgi:hypothetical protein
MILLYRLHLLKSVHPGRRISYRTSMNKLGLTCIALGGQWRGKANSLVRPEDAARNLLQLQPTGPAPKGLSKKGSNGTKYHIEKGLNKKKIEVIAKGDCLVLSFRSRDLSPSAEKWLGRNAFCLGKGKID